ncbi:hypothetical protein SpiGrapes_1249 [Sphaerochaeta pleomorpha str. Grapes]|uniref:DUF4263 domain-containing protein n=1 Tax=Sphaerochaeta pleomorpha (strain ATCC BAA-1885 / DSM 22778 / Grapes) TaxID=158190 RepID=G8QT96_SPHPG|nr:hypothetical protein [Sphaerochaeta pleomorpha]AEV29063.1 hypothetical protein SpiGrapes_1249 [Sphaerochaeta pleomorpha str. Grapes]
MSSSSFLDDIGQAPLSEISVSETKKIDIIVNKLNSFWNNNSSRRILYSILLPDEIESLDLSSIFSNLPIVENQLGTSNWFEFSCDGRYQKSEEDFTNDKECEFAEYSKGHNMCLFFFGFEGVDFWMNGIKKKKKNRLYSYNDLKLYNKKFMINDIEKVFGDYNQFYLSQKTNVTKFFESKRFHDEIKDTTYSILKNRPENLMRDDLKNYLNEHVQGTFSIEYKLNSGNLVDIYTEQGGNELYILEVKWLGKSICNGAKSEYTIYEGKRIKEGIIQTLQYAQEIVDTMNPESLRQAYLVVFDARADLRRNQIDISQYSNDKEELKGYEKMFSILPILKLINSHPA